MSAVIERLQSTGDVLSWTVRYQSHWAVNADESRRVEARWMKRGGFVRCRWQRVGTAVTWETQHDLKWLQAALDGVTPAWRARGTIQIAPAD